jgi:Polyketide cyclase / dehydrase and lipid transport
MSVDCPNPANFATPWGSPRRRPTARPHGIPWGCSSRLAAFAEMRAVTVVAFSIVAGSLSYQVEQLSSADPVVVYDVLMDVERWPDWMPTVSAASWERRGASETGEGGIRRVRMGGLIVREQIVSGARPHHQTYAALLPGFSPIKDIRSDIRIDARPNGCLITWAATFAARIPGLGIPVRFGMRSLIARVAAALAREAERMAP